MQDREGLIECETVSTLWNRKSNIGCTNLNTFDTILYFLVQLL